MGIKPRRQKHPNGVDANGSLSRALALAAAQSEEQREWEESRRQYEEERKQRKAEGKGEPWDEGTEPSVWHRSFTGPGAENESPSMALFGIGCCVAELGVDLKARPETAALVEGINRQFANLRTAFGDRSRGLVDPVVERFCEELDAIAETRPDLEEKCDDLDRQLHEFASWVPAEPDGDDDDVPF